MPKDRKIIELARITTVFNDSCILKLASVAKRAAGADLDALGWWIREAAEMFVLESRIPTRNDLHREIAALYQRPVGAISIGRPNYAICFLRKRWLSFGS
jgi:hypothetical protein